MRKLKKDLDAPTPLPDWLTDDPIPVTPTPARQEITRLMFQNMFSQILDKVTLGMTLSECLANDVRECSKAEFLRWIFANSERQRQYYEAQAISSEITAGEILDIADGRGDEGFMEDIARSTLRINTRKFMMGVANKKRFGDVKQLEISNTISITSALGQARKLRDSAIEATFQEGLL